MKKSFTLLVSLCLLVSAAQAQLYFRLGAGYALPMAKDNIGYDDVVIWDPNTGESTSTTEVVTASYGAGTSVNLAAGYMFSKFLGVELGFNYLMGKSFSVSDNYTATDVYYTKNETETKSKAFFIAPSLILSAGEGTKVPYARFGFIAGVPTVEGEDFGYSTYSGITTVKEWEQKKGTSFGFQGAVGMNWMLSNNFKLNTEIAFASMHYSPDEMVVTSYTRNGQDIMGELPESQKKTIYKDIVDTSSEPPMDQPRQETRINLPFSSVSLQIGVVYVLGGQSVD